MRCVYACISDNRMKTMDEVQRTRKYKKALELAKVFNIDNIVIDVCSSWNRKKPNLEKVLLTPENVIVISDISALGKQDEVQEVYQQIVNTHNEVLICYFNNCGILTVDKLSTVSLSFERTANAPLEERLEALACITSSQFKTDGWRMVDTASIEAYWAHEKGEKSMAEVLAELDVSRNTFLKRVSEYIGSDAWVDRMNQEADDNQIEDTPMRIGEVSEDALKLYEYLEKEKDAYPKYPLFAILEYAKVRLDLYEKWTALEWSNSPEDWAQAELMKKRIWAVAYHLHRQVLKHRKYVKNKKYRK